MNADKEYQKKIKKAEKTGYVALAFSLIASVLLLFAVYNPTFSIFENKNTTVVYSDIVEDEDKIENGVHIRTGLVDAEGLMTVVNNCTNCHSAKLVTQNRADKKGWIKMIRWMQETQGLWKLGTNEEIIVNYLAKNYAPKKKSRRANLEIKEEEWYLLE